MIEPVFDHPFYPHPVLTIPCPWCKAAAGRRCFALFGNVSWDVQKVSTRTLPHNSRMKAAGAKWPQPSEPTGTGWV